MFYSLVLVKYNEMQRSSHELSIPVADSVYVKRFT